MGTTSAFAALASAFETTDWAAFVADSEALGDRGAALAATLALVLDDVAVVPGETRTEVLGWLFAAAAGATAPRALGCLDVVAAAVRGDVIVEGEVDLAPDFARALAEALLLIPVALPVALLLVRIKG